MNALKPIPLSKAKTALGFLRDVQRVIAAEPARADMRVTTRSAGWDDGPDEPPSPRPACGTVGCFAGWVNVLAGGRETALRQGISSAHAFLGPLLDYTFWGGKQQFSVFNAGGGDSCETTAPGTKAHARAVVQRIDRFIKRNEKALRARKLVAAEDGTLSPAPGHD